MTDARSANKKEAARLLTTLANYVHHMYSIAPRMPGKMAVPIANPMNRLRSTASHRQSGYNPALDCVMLSKIYLSSSLPVVTNTVNSLPAAASVKSMSA